MKTFFEWLVEAYSLEIKHSMPKSEFHDLRNKISWLSDSGIFYPLPRIQNTTDGTLLSTHDEWAFKNGIEGGEYELHNAGWLRVVAFGKNLYAGNSRGIYPNRNQISALKDFAISADFDQIVFDGGGNKRARILWQKEL